MQDGSWRPPSCLVVCRGGCSEPSCWQPQSQVNILAPSLISSRLQDRLPRALLLAAAAGLVVSVAVILLRKRRARANTKAPTPRRLPPSDDRPAPPTGSLSPLVNVVVSQVVDRLVESRLSAVCSCHSTRCSRCGGDGGGGDGNQAQLCACTTRTGQRSNGDRLVEARTSHRESTVDNSVDPVEVVSDSSCDSFRTAPLSSLSSNPCRIPTIEYSPLDLSWELIQSPPMAGSSTSTEFVPSHDLKQKYVERASLVQRRGGPGPQRGHKRDECRYRMCTSCRCCDGHQNLECPCFYRGKVSESRTSGGSRMRIFSDSSQESVLKFPSLGDSDIPSERPSPPAVTYQSSATSPINWCASEDKGTLPDSASNNDGKIQARSRVLQEAGTMSEDQQPLQPWECPVPAQSSPKQNIDKLRRQVHAPISVGQKCSQYATQNINSHIHSRQPPRSEKQHNQREEKPPEPLRGTNCKKVTGKVVNGKGSYQEYCLVSVSCHTVSKHCGEAHKTEITSTVSSRSSPGSKNSEACQLARNRKPNSPDHVTSFYKENCIPKCVCKFANRRHPECPTYVNGPLWKTHHQKKSPNVSIPADTTGISVNNQEMRRNEEVQSGNDLFRSPICSPKHSIKCEGSPRNDVNVPSPKTSAVLTFHSAESDVTVKSAIDTDAQGTITDSSLLGTASSPSPPPERHLPVKMGLTQIPRDDQNSDLLRWNSAASFEAKTRNLGERAMRYLEHIEHQLFPKEELSLEVDQHRACCVQSPPGPGEEDSKATGQTVESETVQDSENGEPEKPSRLPVNKKCRIKRRRNTYRASLAMTQIATSFFQKYHESNKSPPRQEEQHPENPSPGQPDVAGQADDSKEPDLNVRQTFNELEKVVDNLLVLLDNETPEHTTPTLPSEQPSSMPSSVTMSKDEEIDAHENGEQTGEPDCSRLSQQPSLCSVNTHTESKSSSSQDETFTDAPLDAQNVEPLNHGDGGPFEQPISSMNKETESNSSESTEENVSTPAGTLNVESSEGFNCGHVFSANEQTESNYSLCVEEMASNTEAQTQTVATSEDSGCGLPSEQSSMHNMNHQEGATPGFSSLERRIISALAAVSVESLTQQSADTNHSNQPSSPNKSEEEKAESNTELSVSDTVLDSVADTRTGLPLQCNDDPFSVSPEATKQPQVAVARLDSGDIPEQKMKPLIPVTDKGQETSPDRQLISASEASDLLCT